MFIICLFVAAGGIALVLLARLLRSYPLAFFGMVATLAAGVLALIEGRILLGGYWILFSIVSVLFAVLWLYKNKRWAFWWSFGADVALILAAVFASGKDLLDNLDKLENLINVAIPFAAFLVIGILFNFVFNFIVPKAKHMSKDERKHLTNVDPLIGKLVTVVKDPEDGRPARAQVGDVDWSIAPFFPGESFKAGDVVKVHQIKGVTMLVSRDGKDYRQEMKNKRKEEAEARRKAKEEEKAKKAAEKEAKKAAKKEAKKPKEKPVKEEPKPVEEPKPEPVKEEPAPVEEPAPQPEPEPEPQPEPQPEPAPVEEPKKEKAEFIPFAVRLQGADDFLKEAYNELKSEVLSYGIKSRVSSAGDKFRLHTKTYVKMVIAGKYLKLYLALDPKDYKDSTYPFEDASRMGAHKDTPFVFKIKSGLSVRRAKVLIGECAKKDELAQGEVVKHDHVADVKADEKDKD